MQKDLTIRINKGADQSIETIGFTLYKLVKKEDFIYSPILTTGDKDFYDEGASH
ncbi:MAG: hypothetical protein NC916_00360 [Candidatus Omnitrophica bacterium]|nr:hypothetical protein [Candidatus Omnitrophota bacterium]